MIDTTLVMTLPTAEALDSYELPELRYFREHFLGSFQLTLDEME